MSPALWFVLLPLGLGLALLIAYWVNYRRLRGPRVVTCPETGKTVGVEIDERRAAWTSVTSVPEFKLRDCSRWPERAACGQDCLTQIEEAPRDCLVRKILPQWYNGRSCVNCDKPFGQIRLSEHLPAMLDTQRRVVEWAEIPADKLESVLATHLPICAGCAVAESFRNARPDLVVDRPPPPPAAPGDSDD